MTDLPDNQDPLPGETTAIRDGKYVREERVPTPIKRRGRPAGSKNKPKIGGGKSIPPDFREEYSRIVKETAEPQGPVYSTVTDPFLATSFSTELLSTPGLPVRLRKRQAFGDTFEAFPVEWPAGWPLPGPGQTVISKDVSGHTNRVEFDLVDGVIEITLQ